MGSNAKDKAVLMNHLRDAHEALTGQRAPDGMEGWKAMPTTIREFEAWLREEFQAFARGGPVLSPRTGFKSSLPRDEEVDPANNAGRPAQGSADRLTPPNPNPEEIGPCPEKPKPPNSWRSRSRLRTRRR